MHKIEGLLYNDQSRLQMLEAVASLNLKDCYLAAGFIRNLVWDYLHEFKPTPLNDVDVIHFDKTESMSDTNIEMQLKQLLPSVNWDVKNQAKMHLPNADEPYANSTDAMSCWPEKETATGARLNSHGKIELSSPFGFEHLFNGNITHNPQRQYETFLSRVNSKNWLGIWPKLKIAA